VIGARDTNTVEPEGPDRKSARLPSTPSPTLRFVLPCPFLPVPSRRRRPPPPPLPPPKSPALGPSLKFPPPPIASRPAAQIPPPTLGSLRSFPPLRRRLLPSGCGFRFGDCCAVPRERGAGRWVTLATTAWRRCAATSTAASTTRSSPSTSSSPSGPDSSTSSRYGSHKHRLPPAPSSPLLSSPLFVSASVDVDLAHAL
jgi:hypothetical protein